MALPTIQDGSDERGSQETMLDGKEMLRRAGEGGLIELRHCDAWRREGGKFKKRQFGELNGRLPKMRLGEGEFGDEDALENFERGQHVELTGGGEKLGLCFCGGARRAFAGDFNRG